MNAAPAPEAGRAASRHDAGAFGEVLASVMAEDQADVPADTAQARDGVAGTDMTADTLALVLAQQLMAAETPVTPETPAAPAAPVEAAALSAPGAMAAAFLNVVASVEKPDGVTTDPTVGAPTPAADDEVQPTFTDSLDSLLTAATSGEEALDTEAASRLNEAIKTATEPKPELESKPGAAQNLAASLANTLSSLTQAQAQFVPANDSGVRFTPAPPTAPETAQAYSLSPHVAENIAALSAQIMRKVGQKTTTFDMELRPSDMGRVDVKLEIGHDGKLSAHLHFDSPVSESEFRGRQDDLRRQLEQAGFQLEDGALSFSSREQGGQRQPDRDDAPVVAAASSAAADAATLVEAQAAATLDSAIYAQMSAAGAYGGPRTLSLSVLV